jgi:hypothetical protein
MTFRSSGLPNSGAKAQHLLLISSANSRSTSPSHELSTRHPPRITPPAGRRGKTYVVSLLTLCGERKCIRFSGVPSSNTCPPCSYCLLMVSLGFSTRIIWPCFLLAQNLKIEVGHRTNPSGIQKFVFHALQMIRSKACAIENRFCVGRVFDQLANIIIRSAINVDSTAQNLTLEPTCRR